ncbi:unnamed protein product [Urochloa humidicola]
MSAVAAAVFPRRVGLDARGCSPHLGAAASKPVAVAPPRRYRTLHPDPARGGAAAARSGTEPLPRRDGGGPPRHARAQRDATTLLDERGGVPYLGTVAAVFPRRGGLDASGRGSHLGKSRRCSLSWC